MQCAKFYDLFISRGLPGTRYDFTLYYTNSTILNFPAWKASITTAPDPPSNLNIEVNRFMKIMKIIKI